MLLRRWFGWVLCGLIVGCGGGDGGDPPPLPPELAKLASRPLAEVLARHPKPEAGFEAVEAYWEGLDGKVPIVEPVPGDAAANLVSFICRGPDSAERVMISGCPPQVEQTPMTRLGATDLWYASVRVPAAGRFTYHFLINGPATLPADLIERFEVMKDVAKRYDPLNPHRVMGWPLVVGLQVPPQPWLEPQPGVEPGTVRPRALTSGRLGAARPWTLYTPAGWTGTRGRPSPAPLLVAFDAEMYDGRSGPAASVPTILDNLIAAGRIPPTVAAFVASIDGSHRNHDLFGSDDFAAFLADELLPAVGREANVAADRSRTILLGASAGGLAAVHAAAEHPDAFGNAVALSGSFVYGPDARAVAVEQPSGASWMSRRVEAASRIPGRFFLDVGQFERPAPASDLVAATRRLGAALRDRGARVFYREVPGGHDVAWWRGSIADALITLLGQDQGAPVP